MNRYRLSVVGMVQGEDMHLLMVTPIYASIMALLILGLAGRVSLLRNTENVALGDGGNEKLRLAMAAHSHALENAPMTLFLMLMLELNRVPFMFLHAAGIALLVSRALHQYGQSRHVARSFGRYWGTVINWLLLIVLALWNLWILVV